MWSLWHHRLGHVSKAVLSKIAEVKQFIFSDEQTCITCLLAKFPKLSYEHSSSHVAVVFDLIHVDTWGPYRTATRDKFKYFLTIVDDHSRMVWVYLMQSKSDYLSKFKSFYEYVYTHFTKRIKVLSSDNAPEFEDGDCREFYRANGMVHQTSCVNRPQQNARVERKHRNILEVARALRLQAGLELKYWGDCVMTAVYIINRLPTQVLDYKVPYEILFKESVDYGDFKVFGCLSFTATSKTTTDKFANKAIPCVFLGYPPHKKGYRLLDLMTNEILVSRDVKFHEHVFPFNKNSTDYYMTPIPT